MTEPAPAYRVLARKYRPTTFAELIGQEALVRTLSNAITTGRIAHAFILTGVRGVGKTTTARIMARALNCVGPDPDVKFIFATTEINKVPVTVLSRCQRFSLRRVPVEQLTQHYARIAEAEGVTAEPSAIALIARAADGSVRDGLSLLDQAIALGSGTIAEAAVRDMLGIADRSLLFDLLEAVLGGAAPQALDQMAALYQGGADPVMVLQDLLELTHFLTRLKLVPDSGKDDPMVEGDRARGLPLAQKLAMPVLARTWQMLLKGIAEVQIAPSPLQAAEMVLVRLAYVAELPPPADLVKAAAEGRDLPLPPGRSAVAAGPAGNGAVAISRAVVGETPAPSGARLALAAAPAALSAPAPLAAAGVAPQPQNFREVIVLFDEHREAVLRSHLWSHCHLVHFEQGRIELRLAEAAPRDLPNRLGQLLSTWTQTRWVVSVSSAPGEASEREKAERHAHDLRSEAEGHPMVRAVLEAFPGAQIDAVRELQPLEPPAAPAADADEQNDGEDIA
jgi:DNA polymerase-3 subunit gamma/tau